jgi:DNA-binding MarR family transcriptional regulator
MSLPYLAFLPKGQSWIPVPLGLKGNESTIWMALWMSAGKSDRTRITDPELALASGLSRATVSRHLQQIEAKGFLTRTQDQQGRVIELRITKKDVRRQARQDGISCRLGKDGTYS